MKKIIEWYKNRYYISKLDLADSAETNRMNMIVVCPFLFAIGLSGFTYVLVAFHDRFQKNIPFFILYFIYLLASILFYPYLRWAKGVPREKAYIYKTIPLYVFLLLCEFASVYDFYVLGQAFIGVVFFGISGVVALVGFSFSPLIFFLVIICGLAALAPGVYRVFGFQSMMILIFSGIIYFLFALYKRHVEKTFMLLLRNQRRNLEAKTFGNFTLLYEGKVIKFARTKSTELLAYLIYKNGTSANSKELLSVLYGEYADSARYGVSLRNCISDIKHTLSDLGIQKFFVAEYNNFRINPEIIKCDYYDFLNGEPSSVKSFAGEFMSQFSWAEDAVGFLEKKALHA